MYVNLGYAVVATDYVGLGTSFRNASFDAPSNATDVINSVKAARKAVAELGARWIALGEANGGISALFVAELQDEADDHDYLGSVSILGILDLKVATERLGKGTGKTVSPFSHMALRPFIQHSGWKTCWLRRGSVATKP